MSTEAGREYDEMEGMKQLEKQIEKLTDVFSKLGEKVKVQQIGQHAKIYAQTQKGLKLDEKHHDLRMRQIDQQKRATIEVFAERQKEIRQTKLLTKAMKQQVTTYDKVFRSLGGGGNSIGGGLNMMTGKLTAIAKSSKAMLDAEKAFQKKYKDTGVVDKGLLELLKTAEKTFNQDTFNSKTLKGMAGKLSRLAEFMEENQGKILITAGVASVLIGIIGKALNVAPMFQAMFKLMQLAVNMILMPIGTFIGAMVKPALIMIIRTLAPMFQEAMAWAMGAGEAVGKFFAGESSLQDMANTLINLSSPKNTDNPNNPSNPSGNTSVVDDIARFAIPTAAIATIAYTTKKIMPRVMRTIPLWGSGANSNNVKPVGNAGTGAPVNNLKGQGGKLNWGNAMSGLKNSLSKIKGLSPRGGSGGLAFALAPLLDYVPFMPELKTMVGDAISSTGGIDGSGIDQWALNNIPQLGNKNQSNDLLSPLHDSEDAILEGTEGLIDGMKNVEILEEVYKKMGHEQAPIMDSQMTEIMNHFIRMKEQGMTSTKAMENTAQNFVHADATITAKLSSWVSAARKMTAPEGKSKKPLHDALAAQRAYNSGQASADNFFGGGTSFWTKSNQGTESVQTKMEKEAERIKEAFNRANPHTSYADIYGTKETTPSGHKYPTGFDSTGITRAQMDRQNNGLPTTSTGAVDWNSYLNANYAGGQISEPILGVGRSGRTYSFGEHGAETITPNGQMGGGGGITINIGKIEKNADFEQLKPMIQKWILEANSRRGMI